jgi:two-component system catabolic regulation response regulator CreB
MKPTILIVEDEPAIADAIQYALETEGCDTLVVFSGAPAPALLGEQRIDLIILDVGLPDISGFELLKLIRRDSTVPVIFLTARASELDRVVGLELGGDDYVVKPFSPRELAARVKAVLRRSRPESAPPAVASTNPSAAASVWRVDEGRRSIAFHGVALELSRYEFNLLSVFLRKPGQVFSRDQLMAQAWDEPDASMDRTVDAHIKNLRAKLRAIRPDLDPILTHRGVGYALREGL